MKKIYSLFILSILVLTMFVGCQMPTDGTDSKLEAETVDEDEKKFGFNKTVDYTVYKSNVAFPKSVRGSILITVAKENNFAKDNDYTINANNVYVITGSRLDVWLTPENLGNLTNNGTYTVSVPNENYITSSNTPYRLVVNNAPIDGYKKGDQVEILITNGNFDVNTGYGTPEGLYLVNVRIEDKSTGNDIKSTVDLKVEYNKIKFTMPSGNVDVYASFEDVTFKKDYDKNNNGRLNVTTEKSNNSDFDVGLRFTEKVFDNLEYIDGYYVFRVANKTAFYEPKEWDDTHWLYQCIIETTYTEHVLCAIVGEKVTPSGNHKIDLQ